MRANVTLIVLVLAALVLWLLVAERPALPSFFFRPAGFDISWSIIPFSSTDTYGKVFVVGALNTLFLALTTIVLGMALGIGIGIARRSADIAIRVPARIYTAALINTPLILQVLIWYLGVFNRLPPPRDSLHLGNWIALNNRGLFMPSPIVDFLALILPLAALAFLLTCRFAHRFLSTSVARRACIAAGTFGILIALGVTLHMQWDVPRLNGFNYAGGWSLPPGLCVILIALILNNGAYVGEIVRSGLAAVPHGQTEAGIALGLRPLTVFRKVIFPQAIRIVVPPLISQAQDVFKNCALAIVVGFPDLVGLWTNIALNQSGRAAEILITTILFYLGGGLIVSACLSLYGSGLNRRAAT